MILRIEEERIEVDAEPTSVPNVYIIERVSATRPLDRLVFAKESTLSRKFLLREYETGIIRSYVYAIIESNRLRFAVTADIDADNNITAFGETVDIDELEHELYVEFVNRIIAKKLAKCNVCNNRSYAKELQICYYCTAKWRYTRTVERVKVIRNRTVYRDVNSGRTASGRIIDRPYSNIRSKLPSDFEYIRIVESKDSQYFTEEVESYYLPGSNERYPRKLWRGREIVIERKVVRSEG